MGIRAKSSNTGISVKKLKPIVNLVRGMKVEEALTTLRFMPSPAAARVAKTVKSAASNAENNAQLNMNKLRVVRASADQGPVLRRWKAKARGRVGRIRRPSSLIIIEVDEEAVRRMGVTRDNAQL